ncbi:MAG: efflux RND transporter periplasmic adaptor subunit [Gallionella sp.]|nr:efflux RND transporter periplasmic adaptor subunit [Gallionella sp.]MDD4946609.1 efflux RND transporter periplasmic adaptor subunit [Gallionella sp.]MDD5611928.1 efflux RND transporter periplasmic adaptor subunit [Gallionella sp.]
MNKITSLLGFILLYGIQTAYAGQDVPLSAKQIQSLGITSNTLSPVRNGELPGLPAQVVIPGNQLFIISSPLPGMIEKTLVGVGDNVKKGQVLAQLQSPALAETQRGLLQTAVQNQLARENLARDEALYKEGIISESRYRTSKAAALEAAANLTERKNMLRLAGMSDAAISKLQSGNNPGSLLTMTSPIDGVVLEKTASAGQRLDAAVPMFKIGKLSPLALEIQAPLSHASSLSVGATVSIPAYGASGKLTAIGRSLSGANQTILLRGTILQGAENLRPGQFVEVSISSGSNNTEQWNIPNSAISRIDGKTVVFIETASGFHPQPITVITQGDKSSLVSGTFKSDSKIAVSGVSALKASVLGIGGAE